MVSILAQPEGRALRAFGDSNAGTMSFQSSPNPKVGRYQAGRGCVLCEPGFNPRPTRRSGATRSHLMALAGLSLFQSSPNPKVGRYVDVARCTLTFADKFQSSPNPKVGRYRAAQRRSGPAPDAVSILAQPEGRALPGSAERHRPCGCFNPRPTRRSGATCYRRKPL